MATTKEAPEVAAASNSATERTADLQGEPDTRDTETTQRQPPSEVENSDPEQHPEQTGGQKKTAAARLEGRGPPPAQRPPSGAAPGWTPATTAARSVSQTMLHAVGRGIDDSAIVVVPDDGPGLAIQDEEWTLYVKHHLARLFPDLHVSPDTELELQAGEAESPPSFRADISSLRSELTLMRGLIAEMISEAKWMPQVENEPPSQDTLASPELSSETECELQPETVTTALDVVRALDASIHGPRSDTIVFTNANLLALQSRFIPLPSLP